MNSSFHLVPNIALVRPPTTDKAAPAICVKGVGIADRVEPIPPIILPALVSVPPEAAPISPEAAPPTAEAFWPEFIPCQPWAICDPNPYRLTGGMDCLLTLLLRISD